MALMTLVSPAGLIIGLVWATFSFLLPPSPMLNGMRQFSLGRTSRTRSGMSEGAVPCWIGSAQFQSQNQSLRSAVIGVFRESWDSGNRSRCSHSTPHIKNLDDVPASIFRSRTSVRMWCCDIRA